MKKVLIGIMTYNFEEFIDRCIQSALSQSYPCDIFLTDDGSTDTSRAEIMKYEHLINCLFHKDNSGDELRAIEDMIWFSQRYDYLYVLSGDDELYPDSIDNLLTCAQKEEADWVYGGLDVITSTGYKTHTWTYDGFPESVDDALAYMWEHWSLGTTLGSLFSADFLKGKHMSRFPGTTFSLDASTAMDWYTDNPKIRRVRKQVLKYRAHGKSRSATLGHERGPMQEKLFGKMIAIFGEEYLNKCLQERARKLPPGGK